MHALAVACAILAVQQPPWIEDLTLPKPGPSALAKLARVPLQDLILEQKGDPWDRSGRLWTLRPTIQEMQRRAESGTWSDEEWRTVLLDTGLFRTPSRWPASVPLQVCIDTQPWLRAAQVDVRAIDPDLGSVSQDARLPAFCANQWNLRVAMGRHLNLWPFPEGTTRVVFDVSVQQREDPEAWDPPSQSRRLLWRGRITRPIAAVSSSSDVLPATHDPEEARSIRSSLRTTLRPSRGTWGELWVSFDAEYERTPNLGGLGMSLNVELWNGRAVVASTELIVDTEPNWIGCVERCRGRAILTGPAGAMPVAGADPSGWELRIRGATKGIPETWWADRWWDGSFSMPLAEAIENHGR